MNEQSEAKDLIIPVDKQERIQKALQFCGEIKEITIESQEQYDNSLKLCQSVKRGYNSLEEDRKEIVRPINAQVTKVNGEYKTVTEKLKNAETVIKSAMSFWDRKVEMKRIEEQKKLEAEAAEIRRKAEAKAEEERLKAEAYREAGRIEMAEKAEARAESHTTNAETIVAPIVENANRGGAASFSTVYTASITDQVKTAICLLENPSYRHIVSIDLKAIEKLAKTLKGNLVIDGIKITAGKSVTVRT